MPIFNGIEGLLFFGLLSTPGNIRAALLITLGPTSKGRRKRTPADTFTAEAQEPRQRIRFRLCRYRKKASEESSGEEVIPSPHYQSVLASHNPDPPLAPLAPSSTIVAEPPGSPVRWAISKGLIAKVVVGLTIFAACGGYWLTGGIVVEPSDTDTHTPSLRNLPEKQHMLELINNARGANGVARVSMGGNNAAQIQADRMLEECVFSHWDTDGLKPYVRYSLAGGYQNNGENALTSNECNLTGTLLQWNEHPGEMVGNAVEALLESPGHRKTMMDPSYSIVNIGLAWDRNTFKAVQHFEGDFVDYLRLPTIEDGKLELEGRLRNDFRFEGDMPLVAVLIYDPAPQRFTRAQLARTHCYAHGELAVLLLPPQQIARDEYLSTETFLEPGCVDPYTVDEHTPDPETVFDMAETWDESRRNAVSMRETELTLRFKQAQEFVAKNDHFRMAAEVGDLLEEYGAGVYAVVLLAKLESWPEGGKQVISEYSVFHGVNPPGGHGGS